MQKKDSCYITIEGEQLELLPEKGIYWASTKTLFVSDVHLGKIDHFRKNGLAIPGEASLDNYKRLASLFSWLNPQRVIFLGDLFHSHSNQDWVVCKTFFAGYKDISFSLVLGNHDIICEGELSSAFDNIYHGALVLSPFVLTHEPEQHKGLFNLCGHIHPAFRIKQKRQPSMRLPCFWVSTDRCILPAFGTFTGMHTITPQSGDRIFALAEEEVIPCQQ